MNMWILSILVVMKKCFPHSLQLFVELIFGFYHSTDSVVSRSLYIKASKMRAKNQKLFLL